MLLGWVCSTPGLTGARRAHAQLCGACRLHSDRASSGTGKTVINLDQGSRMVSWRWTIFGRTVREGSGGMHFVLVDPEAPAPWETGSSRRFVTSLWTMTCSRHGSEHSRQAVNQTARKLERDDWCVDALAPTGRSSTSSSAPARPAPHRLVPSQPPRPPVDSCQKTTSRSRSGIG